MKAIMRCAAALAVLIVATVPAAPVRLSACSEHNTPVSTAVKGAHAKASSFAPQGHPGSKVYGQPIQPPILHRRKPQQSASTPKP